MVQSLMLKRLLSRATTHLHHVQAAPGDLTLQPRRTLMSSKRIADRLLRVSLPILIAADLVCSVQLLTSSPKRGAPVAWNRHPHRIQSSTTEGEGLQYDKRLVCGQ